MDVYKNLEDSVGLWINTMFPTWRYKFAFDNGPEMETPYLVIDVRKLDAIGREYTSSSQSIDLLTNTTTTTTTQDYEALVRFELVGKFVDGTTSLGDMAHLLEFSLRTQRGYEEQRRNALALRKYNPVRRIPVRRETDTYMYYQLDVTFGYVVSNTEVQDHMEIIGIHGVYHDAGREPDHIIESTIEIPSP